MLQVYTEGNNVEGWGIYLGWIPNLLHNLVDFLDCQFNDAFVHPFSHLQLFDEHVFDVRDDLIAELLCFGRECFLNEEAA
jgi:hypothetical protein